MRIEKKERARPNRVPLYVAMLATETGRSKYMAPSVLIASPTRRRRSERYARPGSNRLKMARRDEAIGMRRKSGDESPHSKKSVDSNCFIPSSCDECGLVWLTRPLKAGLNSCCRYAAKQRLAVGIRLEHHFGFLSERIWHG